MIFRENSKKIEISGKFLLFTKKEKEKMKCLSSI